MEKQDELKEAISDFTNKFLSNVHDAEIHIPFDVLMSCVEDSSELHDEWSKFNGTIYCKHRRGYAVIINFCDGEDSRNELVSIFDNAEGAEELKASILAEAEYKKNNIPPEKEPETEDDWNNIYEFNKDHWDYYFKNEAWLKIKDCIVKEYIINAPFNFETMKSYGYSTEQETNIDS